MLTAIRVYKGSVTGARARPSQPAPAVPPLPAGGLLRRVRSYRAADVLVGIRAFLRRRTACSACDRRYTLPTHRGLYGCGSCPSCGGHPERMLHASITCPLGKWKT